MVCRAKPCVDAANQIARPVLEVLEVRRDCERDRQPANLPINVDEPRGLFRSALVNTVVPAAAIAT